MTKIKSKPATKTKAVITKNEIKCPYCCTSYHPSEIFISETLLGKPADIVKDPLGKIISVNYKSGQEPTLVEEFECDNCGKPFVIEATISYKSKAEIEEKDFSTTKSSLL